MTKSVLVINPLMIVLLLTVSFNQPNGLIFNTDYSSYLQTTTTTTINYEYDALYRLTEAEYSNGDYYQYTYDAVGNRLTESTQYSVNSYQYDSANRVTSVNGVNYTFDDNGNLLSDGVNTYTYDSANRLISVNSDTTYSYNGLGDRYTQTVNNQTTTYVLDLNAGLTQVLDDSENTYMYGLGRISQTNVTTEYFLGDALGSVRQITNHVGDISLAKSYSPYGEVTTSVGDAESIYAYTGEQTDASGLTYLRARYYNPLDGRFLTKDTWGGQANQPLSLNRWNYTNSNPVNYTDPSGHYRIGISGALLGLGQLQYLNFVLGENIFASLINCSTSVYSQSQNQARHPNYDLTGYLALAMTEHGKDWRVKAIANTLVTAEGIKHVNGTVAKALWLSAYLAFRELEGSGKVWDIKVGIKRELRTDGVILCGIGHNCKWVDYSTPGNIHFGYIAYLAKIDYIVAAVAGGVLEQLDLLENEGHMNLIYCFQNALPGFCDNPQDQAAVNFGYMLGEKYRNGIKDQQLRVELNTYALWSFQKPPLSFPIPYQAQPQPNVYGADDFNN